MKIPVLSSVWDWLKIIYNLLSNAPVIIDIINQITDLIGGLSGESGHDEVQTVEQTKEKMKELQDTALKRSSKYRGSDLVGKGRL